MTGTLVKSNSMSNEATMSKERKTMRICRKSSVELMMYLACLDERLYEIFTNIYIYISCGIRATW